MYRRSNACLAGFLAVIVTCGISLVACGGSSSPPKGACVRGSGTIAAACGDDFTSANCKQYGGGDAFYEGKKCADLGFDSA